MNLDELLKRKSILNYDNDNKIICSTFGELLDATSDKNILNPIDQCDIQMDKVKEIFKTYKDRPTFFLAKTLFSFGYVSETATTEMKNTYIFIDGHHRRDAIKEICKNNNDEKNTNIMISFNKLNCIDDVSKLFLELNGDSFKMDLSSNIKKFFDVKKAFFASKIKEKFSKKFKNCFANKKDSHFYTLNSFLKYLHTESFFDQYYEQLDNIDDEKKINNMITNLSDECINYIDKKQKDYFKKLKYIESIKKNSRYYVEELSMIKNYSNMMGCKNNNFIMYLISDGNQKPYHEYIKGKSKKNMLSHDEKIKIWNKKYKKMDRVKCSKNECENEMIKNIPYGFFLHNKNDNLIPVCYNHFYCYCSEDSGQSDTSNNDTDHSYSSDFDSEDENIKFKKKSITKTKKLD